MDCVLVTAAKVTQIVVELVAGVHRPDFGPDGVAGVGDEDPAALDRRLSLARHLQHYVDANAFPPELWVASPRA